MDALYDVCFAGEILEGRELSEVKLKLAKVFKANEATVAKLFSGKTQYVKRNCDRATALKYKKAIEQAGAKPVIRAAAVPTEAPAQPQKPQTAAERISALATAPDLTPKPGQVAAEDRATFAPLTDESSDTFDLAPAGAEVLRPEERSNEPDVQIDTSAIEVMNTGVNLSDSSGDAPDAPDTSHLSMGEVGEDIPTLPSSVQDVSPDISGIALSPEHTDFSDCAPPPAHAPQLDLSALNLAPGGADMLEQEYREKHTAKPPPTDHLSLDE